jgi:hypothetical protein
MRLARLCRELTARDLGVVPGLSAADEPTAVRTSVGGTPALPSVPKSAAEHRPFLALGDGTLCHSRGTLGLCTSGTGYFGSAGEALNSARRATIGGPRGFIVVEHPPLLLMSGMTGVQGPLSHPRPGSVRMIS